MSQYFCQGKILLLTAALAVINSFSSCKKSDDFHTHANPINTPVNPAQPIPKQDDVRVEYYLPWIADKENKVLKATLALSSGRSANNIIEIFPTGHETVKVPEFNGDSTLDPYYTVNDNVLNFVKKYSNPPPKFTPVDGVSADESAAVAAAIFLASNGAFTSVTVVFKGR